MNIVKLYSIPYLQGQRLDIDVKGLRQLQTVILNTEEVPLDEDRHKISAILSALIKDLES